MAENGKEVNAEGVKADEVKDDENKFEGVKELKINTIIGFDGGNSHSLITHPDGKHIVYALGNKVTIMDWATKKQKFLVGHDNIITCVSVSRSGNFIASGQTNHIGFKAKVIIWNYLKMEKLAEHEYHKVRVECLDFSTDDKYVTSIGGRDCGSAVVFNTQTRKVVCIHPIATGNSGEVTCINAMAKRPACFMTAGDNHLALWAINATARTIDKTNVAVGKLRRFILCVEVSERDEVCYCGTTTGDIVKVRFFYHHDADVLTTTKTPSIVGCFAKVSRKRLERGEVELYKNGVRTLKIFDEFHLIVGDGDGNVEFVEELLKPNRKFNHNIRMPSIPTLKVHKSAQVNAAVSAIQFIGKGTILIATQHCEIFTVNLTDFKPRLVVTCHTSCIKDVVFPHKLSEVFATAGTNDIRVWSLTTSEELLRIIVQNFVCNSLVFSYDGKSIISGWSDGVIRSFTPLSGRLIFSILNAHNKGVSALKTTSDGKTLISGGCEGQIRMWTISNIKQELICTLKEHNGPVSCIDINSMDTECASSSTDGTVILWDVINQRRKQILFANTLFMCVKYIPSGVQILTSGSDKKITYWEIFDGSNVRELEGSPTGTVNTLDISPDGTAFVSGGNDQFVKVWAYQEGYVTHIGSGHGGMITTSRFSPDGNFIVTCDTAGSIFIWRLTPEPDKGKKKHKLPVLKKLDQRSSKGEEDIRDLPSVRSNKCYRYYAGLYCDCCQCVNKSVASSSRSSKPATNHS